MSTSVWRDAARAGVPFGLPTVDLHALLVRYALDSADPLFKAPLNQVSHTRRLSDPADRGVVAPNVDTPYSWAWLDLRAGPVVLTMPPHDADRYMSAELFDLYSYVLGYVSPRTAGPEGGRFAVVGPSHDQPGQDVGGVFMCPTELAVVLIRTQLFDEADLPQVVALQDGVHLQAPPACPPLDSQVPPVDVRRLPLDESFLRVLDWMLRLAPVLPEDAAVRAHLAEIGVGTGRLDEVLAQPGALAAVREGLAAGMADLQQRCGTVRSSAEIFGSREFFAGDYLSKAAGALLGILGNTGEEYLGVGYRADAEGRPFDGAHAYRIRFGPDDLPPVAAFWSITVYDADQYLYPNPLHRYVLGSRQVPGMRRDPDGGITLVVAHDDPGPDLHSTWLPVPACRFGLTFRTYLPQAPIRDGRWTAPPVQRVPEGASGDTRG